MGLVDVDLPRLLSRFHPFLKPDAALALGKPRFVMQGETLRLLPDPLASVADYARLLDDPAGVLPRVGEGDAFYADSPHERALDSLAAVRLARMAAAKIGAGPGRRHQEARELASRILLTWRDEAAEAGQTLWVVFLPRRDDLSLGPDLEALRAPLAAAGIPVIDATDAVRSIPPAERFHARGHYTAATNGAVGRAIGAALGRR